MPILSIRVFLIVIIGIFACYSFVGAEEQEGPLYQVRAGDTLYSIAQQFGGSVDSLQELNGIGNSSLLSIGQILLLPGYVGVSGLVDTYLVRPGDSFVSLQFALNNPFGTLIKLNRIVNPYTLYLGQPLIYKIPDNLETPSTNSVTSSPNLSIISSRDISVSSITSCNNPAAIVLGSIFHLDNVIPTETQ